MNSEKGEGEGGEEGICGSKRLSAFSYIECFRNCRKKGRVCQSLPYTVSVLE